MLDYLAEEYADLLLGYDDYLDLRDSLIDYADDFAHEPITLGHVPMFRNLPAHPADWDTIPF